MIISIMLTSEANPALMRNSVHAVVMLVLHGLAGLCIVVGAFRQRETEFRVEGANAFLAVLIPMAVLVLVLPNYLDLGSRVRFTRRSNSPLFQPLVSGSTSPSYSSKPIGIRLSSCPSVKTKRAGACAAEGAGWTLASLGLLLVVALLSVVLLTKSLAPALEAGVVATGAPLAIVGVIIAGDRPDARNCRCSTGGSAQSAAGEHQSRTR